MNSELKARLAKLNDNCGYVHDYSVQHFFCPILYRDDRVALCKGHVINRYFRNSSRVWTVQRSDIDHFYGSHFEADFEALQEKGSTNPENIITDKKLMGLLKPEFLLNGRPIEYYFAKGPVPKDHSQVTFMIGRKAVELVFKIPPSKIEGIVVQWSINKNIQLAALVSLLKAAHLTLFHLCMYDYVFQNGGFFLGRTILGEFFLKAKDLNRTEILNEARSFFSPFVNMVRPAITDRLDLKGTLTDHMLYTCMDNCNKPWAFIIFVQTESHLSSVLVPFLDNEENIMLFRDFLAESDNTLNVKLTQWRKDSWSMHPKNSELYWPKAQFKN